MAVFYVVYDFRNPLADWNNSSQVLAQIGYSDVLSGSAIPQNTKLCPNGVPTSDDVGTALGHSLRPAGTYLTCLIHKKNVYQ